MNPDREIEVLTGEVRLRLERMSRLLWEGAVNGPRIDKWLENFDGRVLGPSQDRLLALYLLSKYVHLAGRMSIAEALILKPHR